MSQSERKKAKKERKKERKQICHHLSPSLSIAHRRAAADTLNILLRGVKHHALRRGADIRVLLAFWRRHFVDAARRCLALVVVIVSRLSRERGSAEILAVEREVVV